MNAGYTGVREFIARNRLVTSGKGNLFCSLCLIAITPAPLKGGWNAQQNEQSGIALEQVNDFKKNCSNNIRLRDKRNKIPLRKDLQKCQMSENTSSMSWCDRGIEQKQ